MLDFLGLLWEFSVCPALSFWLSHCRFQTTTCVFSVGKPLTFSFCLTYPSLCFSFTEVQKAQTQANVNVCIHIYSFLMKKALMCCCLGEDASLPITSGGSYQVLVNNVFYFTQRVVDKLWQGMFNKESKLLVEFIIQLIAQVTVFSY